MCNLQFIYQYKHIKTYTFQLPGDIERVVQQRNARFQKYGQQPLQPFVVVEANNTEVKNTYVSLDNILYKVPSVLKGLDVCFKIYHVLNLKYVLQSEHIWLFIQWCVYGIDTKFDKKIPAILDIVNKINQLKN